MKNLSLLVTFAFSPSPCAALAELVCDQPELEKVRKRVQESIHEMEKARAANHYGSDGHGAKAEAPAHKVEHELPEAIRSVKRDTRTVS
ncbi:MAG: hypothetical protein WBS22_00975 [Methylocystis sp.]